MPDKAEQSLRRRDLLRGVGVVGAGLGSGCWRPAPAVAQPRSPMPDVIVLLPGIMGSVLRKDGRDVWAFSGAAIMDGLRTLGNSLRALRLTSDPPDVDDLGDGVSAHRIFPDTHLLPGLWKIDGYAETSKAVRAAFDVTPGQNFFEFPYDWRRDNRVSARRLARAGGGWLRAWRQSSGNGNAQLILVAHSMGGLVARHFLEVLGGWRDTRMLITFGTPYRGSLNALNFIANGFRKSLGPLSLDLSGLVRSFTSVYQLLPIYSCYDPGDGRLVRVGEASGIPNVDPTRAASALTFHREIQQAVETNLRDPVYARTRYAIHPIVGTYQPTLQSARLAGGTVEVSHFYPGMHLEGDGTVPEVSATPIEPDSLEAQHKTVYVGEVHGSLQNSDRVLDHLQGLLRHLTSPSGPFRLSERPRVATIIDDVYAVDEPVRIRARCEDRSKRLTARVVDVRTSAEVFAAGFSAASGDSQEVELPPLPESTYRVTVGAQGVSSVTDVFLVARP